MSAVEQYRPTERLALDTVRAIANTEMIPRSLRGNVPAIMAVILKGRALGLDDMNSLTAIHFIDGKACTSAETMVGCVHRRGHSITAVMAEGSVTAKGKRKDNGDEMSVEWTMAMATRANLQNKDNWKKYPEAMLWARAVSQLCRMLFPDCLAGVSYTLEEAELSPEERISQGIGELSPPVDVFGPDDTVDGQVLELAEGSGSPADGTEGEPTAGVSHSASVPQADGSSVEPASLSDVPATDDGTQGSIFAEMADKATKTRAKKTAEGDNA